MSYKIKSIQNYIQEFCSQPDWSKVDDKDWNRVDELLILIPYLRDDFQQRQEVSTPERELFWKWQLEFLELTGADINNFTTSDIIIEHISKVVVGNS